jgi:undecaprenyl-diphosphatase
VGTGLFAALSLWATRHTLFPGEVAVARLVQHRQSAELLRYEELADLIGVRNAFYAIAVPAVGVFGLLRRWRLCALVLLAYPLLGLGPLFKDLVERPRPTTAAVVMVREFPGGYAFPSGHSLQAAIVATVLVIAARELLTGPPRRVLQATAVWFALTIGWERIFDGAHWPTDVVGGLLLGCLTTLAVWKAITYTVGMAARSVRK